MRSKGLCRPPTALAAPVVGSGRAPLDQDARVGPPHNPARVDHPDLANSAHAYAYWKVAGRTPDAPAPSHAPRKGFGLATARSESAGSVLFPQPRGASARSAHAAAAERPTNPITWAGLPPPTPPPPPEYMRALEPQPAPESQPVLKQQRPQPPSPTGPPVDLSKVPKSVATCLVQLPPDVENVPRYEVPSLLGLGTNRPPGGSVVAHHPKSQTFTKEFGPSSFYY
jgi:hypothetical protein